MGSTIKASSKYGYPEGSEKVYNKEGQIEKVVLPNGDHDFYEGECLVRTEFPDGVIRFYNKLGYMDRLLFPDGRERFFDKEGKLHRVGGPAIIYSDGREDYFVHGKRHREDGPAIVYPGKFYLDDEQVDPKEVEARYLANRKKSALSRGNE